MTWRSSSSTGAVEYGTTGSYGTSVTSVASPYGGTQLHVAQLPALTAGTVYHYHCGAAGDWSGDYTFRTAPAPGQPFRFVAWGDSQPNYNDLAKVKDAAKARSPDFSIFVGDCVADGTDQAAWDTWFTTMQDLAAVSPLMAVAGNHENNAPNFYNQFSFPKHTPSTTDYNDESYYSFDYGNVHFVGLSTEPVGAVGGPQYLWLKNDLTQAAANTSINWIVVFAHQPPYSSGAHGSNTTVQQVWVPLFEAYGVDLTFWGHDHEYERTKPLYQNQVATAGQPGITYIVTGGAGAMLYNPAGAWFTAFAKSVRHFVEINVQAKQIKIEARDESGTVFDSLVLTKGIKPVWVMDGQLDAQAKKVATGAGPGVKDLYAGFDGRFLYVATDAATKAGQLDHFILVSEASPTGQTAAPWSKAGKVWTFSATLAMESSNSWSGWQTPTGGAESFGQVPTGPGTVMEGMLDIVGKHGSVPSSVFLAAAAYGTDTGGALTAQVPPGSGGGDIKSGEWYELKLNAVPPDGGARDAVTLDGSRLDAGRVDGRRADAGAQGDQSPPRGDNGCGCAMRSASADLEPMTTAALWGLCLGALLRRARRRREPRGRSGPGPR